MFMEGMLAPQHTEFVAHVYIAQAEAALEAFFLCRHCMGWQGVDGRDGAVLVGVAQGEGGLDALVERSAPSMPVEGLLPAPVIGRFWAEPEGPPCGAGNTVAPWNSTRGAVVVYELSIEIIRVLLRRRAGEAQRMQSEAEHHQGQHP